ncbi:hypothetical protein G4B88_005138 [Cannabis sativa]|uniref:RING-type E3 ubiquitin transferase n=1 Tax=Cannabis sativa TaxID=3483 RepID=A0A7J6ESH6_CANSA|nr:hypothetical protein G4B88_005138 [Cannabis sativa]
MSLGGGFCKEMIESHVTYGDCDASSATTSNLELRNSPFKKGVLTLSENIGIASNNDVHELLECPVCMNLMYPPIHQELGNIRCLALEKVAESLDLPCRYQLLGCNDIFPYYSKLKHEKNCKHRPFSCPYAGAECSVTGDIPFLVMHLRDDHKVDMHDGSTFNHRYLGMAPVYMAFLRFMGDDDEAKQFTYSLEVGGNGRRLMWQGIPRSIRDSHRKVRDSQDGLIIQRNLALFFSGGSRQELKLKKNTMFGSNETEISLGRKLEELIECPVCKSVMYPPIQQCSNGHPLCSRCKSFVNRCPTCRRALGNIRCLVLEQMAESFQLSCAYELFGCNAKFPYPNGLKHEKNCEHRLFNCPNPVLGKSCSFSGNISSLLNHLKSHHKVPIYYGQIYMVTYVGFHIRPPIPAWKMIVLRCFESYFCLYFRQVELFRRGLCYMAFVQFMGDDDEATRFTFKMRVSGYERSVSWKGKPRGIQVSHREIHNNENGVVIPIQFVHYLLAGGHSLSLRVEFSMETFSSTKVIKIS